MYYYRSGVSSLDRAVETLSEFRADSNLAFCDERKNMNVFVSNTGMFHFPQQTWNNRQPCRAISGMRGGLAQYNENLTLRQILGAWEAGRLCKNCLKANDYLSGNGGWAKELRALDLAYWIHGAVSGRLEEIPSEAIGAALWCELDLALACNVWLSRIIDGYSTALFDLLEREWERKLDIHMQSGSSVYERVLAVLSKRPLGSLPADDSSYAYRRENLAGWVVRNAEQVERQSDEAYRILENYCQDYMPKPLRYPVIDDRMYSDPYLWVEKNRQVVLSGALKDLAGILREARISDPYGAEPTTHVIVTETDAYKGKWLAGIVLAAVVGTLECDDYVILVCNLNAEQARVISDECAVVCAEILNRDCASTLEAISADLDEFNQVVQATYYNISQTRDRVVSYLAELD